MLATILPSICRPLDLTQSTVPSHAGLSVRFEIAANPDVIAPDEYRMLMRGLNSKQRTMTMYHHSWCKQGVKSLKNGTQIEFFGVVLVV